MREITVRRGNEIDQVVRGREGHHTFLPLLHLLPVFNVDLGDQRNKIHNGQDGFIPLISNISWIVPG